MIGLVAAVSLLPQLPYLGTAVTYRDIITQRLLPLICRLHTECSMGEKFSSTGSNPKAQCRLFSLPTELRVTIYPFVLGDTDLHVRPVAYSSNLPAYPSVPYRGVCKQLDLKITKLIFNNCRVKFDDNVTSRQIAASPRR